MNYIYIEDKLFCHLYKKDGIDYNLPESHRVVKFFDDYENENDIVFSDNVKNTLYSIINFSAITEYNTPYNIFMVNPAEEKDSIRKDNYEYQELRLLFFIMINFNVYRNMIDTSITKDINIIDMICAVSNNIHNSYYIKNMIMPIIMSDNKKICELLDRDDNNIDFKILKIFIKSDNELLLLKKLENRYGKEMYDMIIFQLATPCMSILEYIEANNIPLITDNMPLELIETEEELRKLSEIIGFDKLLDRVFNGTFFEMEYGTIFEMGEFHPDENFNYRVNFLKYILSVTDDKITLNRIMELAVEFHQNFPGYFDVYNILLDKGADISVLVSEVNDIYCTTFSDGLKVSNIWKRFINHLETNNVDAETIFKLMMLGK